MLGDNACCSRIGSNEVTWVEEVIGRSCTQETYSLLYRRCFDVPYVMDTGVIMTGDTRSRAAPCARKTKLGRVRVALHMRTKTS